MYGNPLFLDEWGDGAIGVLRENARLKGVKSIYVWRDSIDGNAVVPGAKFMVGWQTTLPEKEVVYRGVA